MSGAIPARASAASESWPSPIATSTRRASPSSPAAGSADGPLSHAAEQVEDVLRAAHDLGALSEQRVGAGRERRGHAARDGADVAPEVLGEAAS